MVHSLHLDSWFLAYRCRTHVKFVPVEKDLKYSEISALRIRVINRDDIVTLTGLLKDVKS
jgi:hypothetical protein